MNKKPRVLHLINSMDVGGAEKLLLEQWPYFKKYDVSLATLFSSSSHMQEAFTNNGGNITILGKSKYSITAFFKLLKLAKGYELIHAHLFPSIWYVLLLKKLGFLRVKVIITEHSTTTHKWNYKPIIFIERWLYKSANTIIAVSEQVALNYQTNLKLPQDKFTIVYNGIPMTTRSTRRQYDGQINLCMVASFKAEKNQLAVINALPYLSKKYHLHFAGQGTQITTCKKAVTELDLQDRVHFHGVVTNIPELLDNMHIGLLISKNEGFGLAIAEYQSAQLPVITSDIADLRRIWNDTVIYTNQDGKSIAQKIDMIVNNKTTREALIKIASDHLTNFSLEVNVGKIEAVYTKLLGKTSDNKSVSYNTNS